MRRLVALAVLLAPALAHAQGGNPGEGPGWTTVFAVAWILASLIVGTIATAGVLVLRPVGRAVGGTILAAYLLAFPVCAGAGVAALFAGSWWVGIGVIALWLSMFWLLASRRWRA